MKEELERNGVLLTVRLPGGLVANINDYVQSLGEERGNKPSRAAAIRHLLNLALDYNTARGKRRSLRYVVSSAVRRALAATDTVSLARVREELALLPRDVVDATLLELDRAGVLELVAANGAALAEGERAAAIVDPARGQLAAVRQGAAKDNETALHRLEGEGLTDEHTSEGGRRASAS